VSVIIVSIIISNTLCPNDYSNTEWSIALWEGLGKGNGQGVHKVEKYVYAVYNPIPLYPLPRIRGRGNFAVTGVG
jgi:hypothetical protein